MDLTATTALVIGANRGVGRALTLALRDAGVPKIYAASRGGEVPESAGITPLRLDLTDRASIDAAGQVCTDVTLLVNNAGIALGGGPLSAPSLDGLEAELATNVVGTLALTRAFAPVIRDNGGGAIVSLASILALAPIPQVGTNSASKAALHSLMTSLRSELEGTGVRVVTVLPAFVDTDMTAGIAQEKLSPDALAQAILDALRGEAAEVYPGPAAAMAMGYHADPQGFAAGLGARFAKGEAA